MSISIFITLLKELGVSSIFAILVMINMPSMIFGFTLYNKLRADATSRYIPKETYDKDIKSLYTKTLQPLREDLNKLRQSIDALAHSLDNQREIAARHDERFKMMHGTQNS